MSNYNVSINKISAYDFNSVYSSIKKGLDNIGGIKRFINKGDKVLLKPNLLGSFHPDKAVTTHPIIVKSVIRLVKEIGATPFVGDSPAFQSFFTVIKSTKIKDVCDEENVTLVNLNKKIKINNLQAIIDKYPEISQQIQQFDKIINLPKLKTHILTKMTVAVKNMFGVVSGTTKSIYHYRYSDINNFSHMLLDLNLIVKPVLTIVDGIIGLEGEGPGASGIPRKVGIVIVGDDTVAVDMIAAKIMNYEPYSINFLSLAKERKQGGYKFSIINLPGEKLDSVIVKDFKKVKGQTSTKLFPSIFGVIFSKIFVKKPYVNFNKCVGCGDCAKICPADTIKILNKKAIIDYNNCIKCYCCIEVCPFESIVRKRLFRIN